MVRRDIHEYATYVSEIPPSGSDTIVCILFGSTEVTDKLMNFGPS